jgi:hypothetical protein
MTNPNGPETRTDMVLSPRQEKLVEVRDGMRTGERPGAIVPRTFVEVELMCKALAGAGLIPATYREKPADMMLVVMSGAELGLPPMASLRLYHVIEGVPRLGAEGVRAIIIQSPDCEYFEFAESSPERAVWIGKKVGRPEKSITWTMERARKAGLAGKATWQKSPEDLLNARASMQLGRLIWPHIVAGLISREEAMDGPIDVEWTEAPKFSAPAPRVQVVEVPLPAGSSVTVTPATPPERKTRSPRPATVPTSPQSSGDGSGASEPKTSSGSAAPSAASTAAPPAAEVVLDKWGQAVAQVEAKNANPTVDPAKAEAAYVAAVTGSSIASTSSTASTSEPSSGAGADDLGDAGFEDEDPVDSQPTYDQAGFIAWLASCMTQTQLTREADPWIAWNGTIGDLKIQSKLRPEVVANRKLYAARKAELPL